MTPSQPHPRFVLALALAAAMTLAGGCASMHTSGAGAAGAGTGARLSAEDRVFAMQAAGGGMYEIEAGRLAAQRAANPEVRAFGQMLADHHGAANADLVSLLQGRGLVPPAALPPSKATRLSQLSPLAGPAFDSAFIRSAGIADHQQQIALFQQASRDVADPALRAWFTRTLAVLRGHLGTAQDIAGRIAG